MNMRERPRPSSFAAVSSSSHQFNFATMIISEKNRREISKYLFQEGVCYAKKDYNLAKHPEIDVPNLQVIKLMQSFKSKEYVRETFAWMHYYWYLTNDGIEFLRNYLNLPSEIVPATLKKQAKPPGRPLGPSGDRPRGPPRFDGGERRFGDRDGYRSGPRAPGGDFGDKGGAPADYRPSFGRPRPSSFAAVSSSSHQLNFATMIISEKNRREISKYLFQEGVCYAKKDYNLAKHPEIDVPNLQVIKLMQSFKSKEYVRETFAWMHYYWYLTNDGIEFLRNYLNLPSEIVPATLKKQAKPPGRPLGPSGDRPRGPPRFDGGERRFGDRDGYRSGPRAPGGDFGDKGGAPADYRPSFGGSRPGFGRGAGGSGGAGGFGAGPASSDLS
ncbi:RNA binding Plectin/S10 domain-containing protein [Prunus dulcis]|uniref:RNA binding Plectin/S10 domain-containing protein n=5 Tax=Prunus TaxID=3754 RepID=A0A4Y1QVM8_PRUDU|nr:RNA binding Plectin/S10 domain-containing protein [Prunus dulcis]